MKRSLLTALAAVVSAAMNHAAVADELLETSPTPITTTMLPRVELHAPSTGNGEEHWSFPYGRTRSVTEQFRDFPRPHELVRFSFFLEATDKSSFTYEGLRFSLEDDEQALPLPHHLGWGDLPTDPPLDVSRARFHINRPMGSVVLRRRVSVALRADGTYVRAYLEKGCEQAFDVLRHHSFVHQTAYLGKRCDGIAVVPLVPDVTVTFVDSAGQETRFKVDKTGDRARREIRWSSDVQAIRIDPPASPHILGILVR